MAEVWMGRRELGEASKAVAIKLLAANLAQNPVYRRMFIDEARLSMMLTHSNLVQVFDVGEHGGRSYLVMEWVDGLDLARLGGALREAGERLPIHVVAHVIGEILRGLAYVHELGSERGTIVHRDISPHNVLISVSGEVKISDFGVARLSTEETSGLHVRGKLRYMPPEQVRGDSKHPRVDLFAVGAVMHELLDGVRFRAGLERDALFGMVLAGQIPPLQREDVPVELLELHARLLEPEVGMRIDSAREALALLRSWPGYRNASDELSEYARRFVGVAAPRSGLEVECSDEQLEPLEPTFEDSRTRTGVSEPGTGSQRGPGEREAESETTPALGARELGKRSSVGRLVAVFALAGLVLGLAGAYLLGRESEPLGMPTSVDEPTSVGEPASMDDEARSLEREPPPQARPLVVASAPPRPPPLPEPQAVEREPAPEPETTTISKPASVEFAAHQFFFAYVKVGGKVLALEPVAKLELRAGSHTVYLREREDQAWVRAGKVKVEAGKRYRVKLEKPGRLAVSRLD